MILLQSGLRVKDDGAFCRRGVNSSRITWLKGLLICKQGIRCEWVTLCSLGTVIKPLAHLVCVESLVSGLWVPVGRP